MTPNKDIVGEEREELNKPNRGEANGHVIHSVGDWVDDEGVPGDYNSLSPMFDKSTFSLIAAPCSHTGSRACGQSGE